MIRLVEASGSSTRSWNAAVVAAVKASDIRDPIGVEVARLWADLKGARFRMYHASVKVAYRQSLAPPSRKQG